ncbi:hypothetical protein CYMTET_6671 [Cymbomonas tetramitiformis]|uniref:Uncharacterized protein n=1 Tax=Cymbomonas tetramitiformis TaxID=36881 RepID=A0AAE0LHU7_9CHLO|nr:hypothetical protein CYMTET_6671 [Cymbomonas tetramitiformis]
MLNGQRAAVDLVTIQLWTRKCYANTVKSGMANGFTAAKLTEATEEQPAIVDLTSIILDLKGYVKNLTDRMDGAKGFTPRAAKPNVTHRFAAKDIPSGGNWGHTEHNKRVAFQGQRRVHPRSARELHVRLSGRRRDIGTGIARTAGRLRTPPITSIGMLNNMTLGDYENDLYAEQFQAALESDDGERFDALCLLAGGKPEMCCDEISTCSFGLA